MISTDTAVMVQSSYHSFLWVLGAITVILHILIAAGIAKDIGERQRRFYPIHLISGSTWILAAVLSGLWALGLYWLMHHSALAMTPPEPASKSRVEPVY
jgi:hypothetical protein